MVKFNKKQDQSLDYLKNHLEGFPLRINWVCIAGGGLSEIQEYDLIYDQKDLDIRFPPRNTKLVKSI